MYGLQFSKERGRPDRSYAGIDLGSGTAQTSYLTRQYRTQKGKQLFHAKFSCARLKETDFYVNLLKNKAQFFTTSCRMDKLIKLLIAVIGLNRTCQAQVPSTTPPKRLEGDGLRGEYFNGYAFNQAVRSQVDFTINFFYDGRKPPVSGVLPQMFSVRWSGQLLAPVTGYYTFSSIADDGVRIWVGGVKVMEEWREKGRKLFSRRVYLQAGRFYAIRLDYVNYRNGGYVDLDWETPKSSHYSTVGFIPERTIIPTAYLFSEPTEMPRVPPPPIAAKPILTVRPVRPAVATRKITPKPVAAKPPARTPPAAVKPPDSPPAAPVNPFDGLKTTGKQTLDNVNFEQSSYSLLPESYPELNQLAVALKRFPAWHIEVSGHTDNVGDSRLNQTLSEYRAKVVAAYLARQGIDESRIDARGYGGSRPLVDNHSEANRARNRRVEITVMHR